MVSDRTKNISYAIRDVVVEAQKLEKQGHKIIYLNIGDPLKYDFSTPKHMIEAVERNWRKSSSYADSLGLREARQAVSRDAKKQGITVSEEEVIMTSGGSEGISMALGALLNRGDNVLTPKPNYPLYNAISRPGPSPEQSHCPAVGFAANTGAVPQHFRALLYQGAHPQLVPAPGSLDR